MATLTRGPLPARVYWRRRLMLLVLAALLVLGLGRLLGTGSDASGGSDGDRARQVAAEPTATASRRTPAATTATPERGGASAPTATTGSAAGAASGAAPTPVSPPPPIPTGPCPDADIVVTPSVRRAVAGQDVRIVLELRATTVAACSWQVSPRHLTLKITSGDDDIWASWQCPRRVPKTDIVVSSTVSRRIHVVWNARRSEDHCPRLTEWALPGYYHVAAAALGGEPSDVQFELARPEPRVVVDPPRRSGDRGADRAGGRTGDRAGDGRRRQLAGDGG